MTLPDVAIQMIKLIPAFALIWFGGFMCGLGWEIRRRNGGSLQRQVRDQDADSRDHKPPERNPVARVPIDEPVSGL